MSTQTAEATDLQPIPTRELTVENTTERLDFAASQAASDLPEAQRWAAWFAYQTGIAIPGDIFEKYAQAIDWKRYTDQFKPEASLTSLDAADAVRHYETALRAIILGHIVRPFVKAGV